MNTVQFGGFYVVKTANSPYSSNGAKFVRAMEKEGFSVERGKMDITIEQWDKDNRVALQLPDAEDKRFEQFLQDFKEFPIESAKFVGKPFLSFRDFFKAWGEKISLPSLNK